MGEKEFLLRFDAAPRSAHALRSGRLQRAIGVIYRPETERRSHYFRARLADQFDAVIHVDQTRAVEPLERTAGWEEGEMPETYPCRYGSILAPAAGCHIPRMVSCPCRVRPRAPP